MNITVAVYAGRVRGLGIAFGAWVAVGCGAAAPPVGPHQTVEALVDGLRSGDAEALASLSGRVEADVRTAQETSGNELHALGETLARGTLDEAARVYLVEGAPIALVREGEAWRVDRGVLGRPTLTRPVDAVIAFHDTLARSRVEGVLSLLSRGARAEAEVEVERWILGTADPDALAITVSGESATVTTPLGDHLDLVRESGEWRIVELR